MENQQAADLLRKYQQGLCSEAEKALVESWFLQETADIENTLPEPDHGLAKGRIWAAIQLRHQPKARTIGLWPRVAAAAAIIVLLGAGLLYINRHDQPPAVPITADASPGKQGATLTLSDGSTIRLDEKADGEIARQAGIPVIKTANGEVMYKGTGAEDGVVTLNTLSTANGEVYNLVLPDGSKVWMNAATKLTYSPALLQQGVRRVKLEGEAYFEIAKDKAHPFVVESSGQEVTVLGTHFNINSYANEPVIITTLMEGSVKVAAGNKTQLLQPGQQALQKGNVIDVMHADVENVIDWKNGDFNLDKVNFKTALRKIARWYDVEVIYDPAVPDDIEAGGWISRQKPLSAVLKLIESSGQVHFRLEGKKLHVLR